jgi:hypothetical protein
MDMPEGRLFSHVYLRAQDLLPDSPRFRIRLGAHLLQLAPGLQVQDLCTALRLYGLEVSTFEPEFLATFRSCPIGDALDAITIGYRFALGSERPPVYSSDARPSVAWLTALRGVLAEERLGYRIDDAGGVHFLVDPSHEAFRVALLAGFGAEHLKASRTAFEAAMAALEARPLDARRAMIEAYVAGEQLFRIVTRSAKDLSVQNVETQLRQIVETRTAGLDATEQRAQRRMVTAFGAWADAGQPYRYGDDGTMPRPPSPDFAIAYVSGAATFLRWLARFSVPA